MERQIYYRPADLTTAKYLEDRLGLRSAYARSATSRDGEETSEGQMVRAIPLLSSQEIAQITDREVIGFHRHLPPFRLDRLDWRKHPSLQQRRNIQAPRLMKLPTLSDLTIKNRLVGTRLYKPQ